MCLYTYTFDSHLPAETLAQGTLPPAFAHAAQNYKVEDLTISLKLNIRTYALCENKNVNIARFTIQTI